MTAGDRQGTLEVVASQLALLLSPLRAELRDGRFLAVLAELGYVFPPEVFEHANLVGAIETTLAASSVLSTSIGEVTKASDDEDLIALGAATVRVIDAFRQLNAGIDALAAGVDAAATAVGGLTPAEAAAFAAELPTRLVEYSVVRFLDETLLPLSFALELFGVIERTDERTDSTDPLRPPYTRVSLHLDRLPEAFASPGQVFEDLYGWGTPGFDGVALFTKVASMLSRIGFPSIFDRDQQPPVLDLVVAEMRAVGGALEVMPRSTFGEELSIADPDEGVRASAKFKLRGPAGATVTFAPDGSLVLAAPGGSTTSGELRVRFEYAAPAADIPVVVLGQQGGTRIEARKAWLELGGTLEWDADRGAAVTRPELAAAIEDCSFVLVPPAGDGLIGSFVPDGGTRATFSLRVGLDRNGFHFQGSGALEVNVPVHRTVGPLTVKHLVLGLTAEGGQVSAIVAVSIGIQLGPFAVEIDRIGARLDAMFGTPDPNLGFANVDIGMAPPRGAGISVNGGPVTGGGLLRHDPATGRYSGAITLQLLDHDIAAFGVIDTKLPDGGYALVIAIQARIPPIPLGLGFNLLGVGGMLGVNRGAAVDVIRENLRTGGLANILFPPDPISNFDEIAAEIDRVFPITPGRFLIGPTAKIGWGSPTLITADLGYLVELPSPIRTVPLGVVRCFLPDADAPVLRLQASFVGTIDLSRGEVAFDASLFDSRLLTFAISGDMSARLKLGGILPNFLLTVGGFHPAFTPPPMGLPALRRITINLLGGNNPRLRGEMYFARTSNSFQVGANIELYAAVSRFNVYGFVGFDALFQVRPLKLAASMKATLAVRIGDDPIMSVGVELSLEGPGPWHAKGSAHFSICWFLSFSVRFEVTWGDPLSIVETFVDLLPLLVVALRDPGNWRAPLPSGVHALVTLRDTNDRLLDPSGTLEVRQTIVPLDLEIQRFSTQRPRDATRFSIKTVSCRGDALDSHPLDEQFAPAEFLDMSDADKLHRPSFERFHAGVTIASASTLVADHTVETAVEYERIIIDKGSPSRRVGRAVLDAAHFGTLASAVLARSPLARNQRFAPRSGSVAIADEGFTVVSSADLSTAIGDRVLTYTAAVAELARLRNVHGSAAFHVASISDLAP